MLQDSLEVFDTTNYEVALPQMDRIKIDRGWMPSAHLHKQAHEEQLVGGALKIAGENASNGLAKCHVRRKSQHEVAKGVGASEKEKYMNKLYKRFVKAKPQQPY